MLGIPRVVNIYRGPRTKYEYHSVCPLVRIEAPSSPLPQASVSHQTGRTQLPAGEGIRGPNSDDWGKSLEFCLLRGTKLSCARPPPLPPFPLSNLDRRHTGRLRKRDKVADRGGGRGWAWSRTIRPQENLALFNTLWVAPSSAPAWSHMEVTLAERRSKT
jgi:hypothetical protein